MRQMTPLSIAIDFDGVIAQIEPGTVDTVVGMMPLAATTIRHLRDAGWTIIIYTSRHGEKEDEAKRLCAEWGVEYDGWNVNPHLPEFPGKPPAHVYLDDRAIRFTSWPQAHRQIQKAKPR